MHWKNPKPEQVWRGIRWRFFFIVILASITLIVAIHGMTTPSGGESAAAFYVSFYSGVPCIILCTRTLKRITVYQYLTTPHPAPPEPPRVPPESKPPQEPDEGMPIGTTI